MTILRPGVGFQASWPPAVECVASIYGKHAGMRSTKLSSVGERAEQRSNGSGQN